MKKIFLILGILVLLIQVYFSSKNPDWFDNFFIKPKDYMHIVLFFILALFLFFSIKIKKTLIVLISFGLLDEFVIQRISGRNSDLNDFFRDLLGIFIALIIFFIFSKIKKRNT